MDNMLKAKVSYLSVIDTIIAIELRQRREKITWDSLDIYYNILVGLGRMHGLIETDEEETFILAFLVNETEKAQEAAKK